MPDIIKAIESVAEAAGAISKEATQRDAEKNAPDVKAGAEAVADQKTVDQLNADMKEGNLDAIRKADA